jgi:endogenous inhibitor of DNA gyrase (YacG/DUF329 family)
MRKIITPEFITKMNEKKRKPLIIKCKNCGKEIFYPRARDYKGNFCSKECKKLWLSKVMKEKWKDQKYKERMLKIRRSPKTAKLIKKRQKEHDLRVMEVARKLEEEGFKVIPIDTTGFPLPDLIAIKGENVRIYGVEVTQGKPEFGKWDLKHPFDDIWWILIKENGKTLIRR